MAQQGIPKKHREGDILVSPHSATLSQTIERKKDNRPSSLDKVAEEVGKWAQDATSIHSPPQVNHLMLLPCREPSSNSFLLHNHHQKEED